MSDNRNRTLDVLKLFASYMVVFIHVMFYGKIGVAVDALARFAVPLFFVVSGFYSYEISLKQIKKRVAHTLQLIAFAAAVYILWNVLQLLIEQDTQGLVQYLNSYLSIKNLLKLLVFNIPLFTVHLWYLFALLYVYVFYYFAVFFSIRKRLVFSMSILLLVLHVLLGEGLSIFKIVIPIPLVRNFALMGIPFFGLGLLTNTYKQKLCNTPNYMINIFLMVGILETVFSRYFFGKNELYIGSLFVLLACIVTFIKFPNIEYPSALISLTSCSTYIYIFHPLISKLINKLYPIINISFDSSVFLQMIHPILVCVLSTFWAYLLNKLSKQQKR